ncbi:MAG: hypothetical protein HC871_14060 [Rhizobiales bacterium]|nr:hypothetical protein [Hyphomicrobiales bacterium]
MQTWTEPAPLLRAGIYWPGEAAPDLDALRARPGKPIGPWPRSPSIGRCCRRLIWMSSMRS